jgi:hypothetical protein
MESCNSSPVACFRCNFLHVVLEAVKGFNVEKRGQLSEFDVVKSAFCG